MRHSSLRSSRKSLSNSKASLSTNTSYGSSRSSAPAYTSLPDKQQNFRILVINCNSCKGKTADFIHLFHYTDLDMRFICETKIDSTRKPSELLPSGGVMIIMKVHLTVEEMEIVSNSETVWPP